MPAETPQGHAFFSLEMWSSIITAPASAIEAPATTWWAGTTVGMARPMLLASNKLKKKKERRKLIVHTLHIKMLSLDCDCGKIFFCPAYVLHSVSSHFLQC